SSASSPRSSEAKEAANPTSPWAAAPSPPNSKTRSPISKRPCSKQLPKNGKSEAFRAFPSGALLSEEWGQGPSPLQLRIVCRGATVTDDHLDHWTFHPVIPRIPPCAPVATNRGPGGRARTARLPPFSALQSKSAGGFPFGEWRRLP